MWCQSKEDFRLNCDKERAGIAEESKSFGIMANGSGIIRAPVHPC